MRSLERKVWVAAVEVPSAATRPRSSSWAETRAAAIADAPAHVRHTLARGGQAPSRTMARFFDGLPPQHRIRAAKMVSKMKRGWIKLRACNRKYRFFKKSTGTLFGALDAAFLYLDAQAFFIAMNKGDNDAMVRSGASMGTSVHAVIETSQAVCGWVAAKRFGAGGASAASASGGAAGAAGTSRAGTAVATRTGGSALSRVGQGVLRFGRFVGIMGGFLSLGVGMQDMARGEVVRGSFGIAGGLLAIRLIFLATPMGWGVAAVLMVAQAIVELINWADTVRLAPVMIDNVG